MPTLEPGTLCLIVGGSGENAGRVVKIVSYTGLHEREPRITEGYQTETASGRPFLLVKGYTNGVMYFARNEFNSCVFDRRNLCPLNDPKVEAEERAHEQPNFQQKIREIVSELTQTGPFKKVVATESGDTVIYRVSLASGWGSDFRAGEYQRHFGKGLPKWAQLRHPYHIMRLCTLAITHNRPLPNQNPLNSSS